MKKLWREKLQLKNLLMKKINPVMRLAVAVSNRSRLGFAACLILLTTLLAASCRRQGASVPAQQADIAFPDGTEHDFGMFRTQDTLVHYFVYKNTGTVPLVIQKVETSCGCTRATFSKKPLAPGGTDSIRVAYDGNGFSQGTFIKGCDIYSNTDTVYHLRIRGYYLP